MGYPDMMRDVLDQARREEIKKKNKSLENLIIIDNLTGLYNQKYFHLRLEQEMARSKLYGNKLSLIFLGICDESQDEGKSGNKACHDTMKVVAEIVSICLSDTIDLAFSYSNEKIAVILPEINKVDAAAVVQEIKRLIQKEKRVDIKLHAGVVQYESHEYIEDLIGSADDALTENMKSEQGG